MNHIHNMIAMISLLGSVSLAHASESPDNCQTNLNQCMIQKYEELEDYL